MTDRDAFEHQLEDALREYIEAAPTEIDAAALTRSLATNVRRRRLVPGPYWKRQPIRLAHRLLVPAFVVVAIGFGLVSTGTWRNLPGLGTQGFAPGGPDGSATGMATITKHVDGSVVVAENADRTWLARFEVRTTTSGDVQFGYLELYGIGGQVAGQIHQFTVYKVDYYKTATGAQGATLQMKECVIVPSTPCFDSPYQVSDGSAVGRGDTFMGQLGWTITSGGISIYTTNGQDQ